MSTAATDHQHSNPPNPFLDAWQEYMAKVAALPGVMQAMQGVRVGATPSRTVHREDNVRLLRYESEIPQRYQTPLLVVFALVNRPYILDLKAGKSVVSHFLNRGFDVYNLDWGVPSGGDRGLGLEDYVLGYLDHAIDTICKQRGCEQVNLLGYCMGGSMSAMYTALRPSKVKNLMLLAAPVDWSGRESLLSVWTDPKYFDVDKVVEVYGNMPPQWLQSSFLLLRPVQNLIQKYISFYDNMEDERFVENFFAMETWLNDNIPVAGEVFRQFVKYCFQQNRLIQGTLTIADETVDLKRICCPVLNLVAEQDHLVPPAQSVPLNDAVSSEDSRVVRFPAGHIGMAVGSRAHRDLWPEACTWLEQRSMKLDGSRSREVDDDLR